MDGSKGHIASDLLSGVSKFSPILGTVLGSPLAGIAVSMIAKKFGVEESELPEAIASDPNAAVKIKEIEADYGIELAKVASQNYSTEVDDRKDARAHSVEYPNFLRHMAYLVTAGFFITILIIFSPEPFNSVNPGEREMLSLLIGMLVSKWQTIIDFFYGSSNRDSFPKDSLKNTFNQKK